MDPIVPEGLVIKTIIRLKNSQRHMFLTFLRNDGRRWTGNLPDCVYLPIWRGFDLLSPISADYSEERPIVGVNFFPGSH